MTDLAELAAGLAAPFDETFHDVRGGVSLTYISGEQVVSRLNEVLGPFAWTFTVDAHGINNDADEVWVLGTLTVQAGDVTASRQQFGSQKLKRSRQSGTVMDIGFDLKGASTDCLKKCAQLFGVGLYLSKRDAVRRGDDEGARRAAPPPRPAAPPRPNPPSCSSCGVPDLARGGFIAGQPYCGDCYAREKATRAS